MIAEWRPPIRNVERDCLFGFDHARQSDEITCVSDIYPAPDAYHSSLALIVKTGESRATAAARIPIPGKGRHPNGPSIQLVKANAECSAGTTEDHATGRSGTAR